nr:helix-turn-helix domain-containing protein [Kineosporia mesophila]
MPAGEPISDDECRRATAVVKIVTKRWTSAIMLALGRGATRFGQMEALVEGISARLLSARLRELEQHHLLERVVTPTVPVSVRYHLTPRGLTVLTSMHNLAVPEQHQDVDQDVA